VKRIVIFIAGVTTIAWGSNFLASRLDPSDPAIISAGVSIGALGPLFMAVVLRVSGRLGWGDAGLRLNFKSNRRWYALSVFFTPLVLVVVAAISLIGGVAQMTSDRAGALATMLTTFGIVLVPMTFLSISEEFGWRGYLEPSLRAINPRVVLNHVLVGIVWGFWHFPILLFNPTSETSAAQLAMVLIGCVALAIIYGQVRLWSDSVWPCVILHALSNAVTIAVASSKLLLFDDGVADLISFNTTSLAVTGAWVIASLLVLALTRKGLGPTPEPRERPL